MGSAYDTTYQNKYDDLMTNPKNPAIDYQQAFDLAPVGLVLSRHRTMVDCNQAVCDMFGASHAELIGQSFQLLYPSVDEFERTGERIAPILNTKGHYADERLMKRVGGPQAGEVFWCHVTGRALHTGDPHHTGIWSFEDMSAVRSASSPISSQLSPREREVAALLSKGMTAKGIGKELGISHRTVEIHRGRLLRKYDCHSTAALIIKLAGH